MKSLNLFKNIKLKFNEKRINKELKRFYDLGESFLKIGHLEEAIDCFETYLEAFPDDYLAWYNKGVAISNMYFASDQKPSTYLFNSLECMDKTLDLKNDYYLAWLLKGILELKIQNPIGSIESLKRTIELNPDCLDAIDLLDSIYEGYRVCNPDLEDAVKNNMASENAWYDLAVNYSMTGQKLKMFEALKNAVGLNGNIKSRILDDAHFRSFVKDPEFVNLIR